MTARLRGLIGSINSARPSVTQSGEHLAAVQGDVVGLAALDLVLWRLRARVMHVALVDYTLGINLNDRTADTTSLRIPTHPIPDLKPFRHHERRGAAVPSCVRSFCVLRLGRRNSGVG